VPAYCDALIQLGAAATLFSVARPISTIEREIRDLSTSDKEGLLRVLLEELDGPPDPDTEAAWLEEVHRRSGEIESGTVKPVSSEEVLSSIESALKK
jgi:putative addiction module component (TIGR02574 family)